MKVTDLWRYESGVPFESWLGEWNGWEHFTAAHARGKGVLLVTPHLGNWEFGGAFLVEHGYPLLVLTQPEPDQRLTELRQRSRALRGVETLVVGEDAFAFIEIIKRLQAGATVALLLDRPPAPTAVNVESVWPSVPGLHRRRRTRAGLRLRHCSGLYRAPVEAVISRIFCRKSPMTARRSATATPASG